jgi:hypothetical protein
VLLKTSLVINPELPVPRGFSFVAAGFQIKTVAYRPNRSLKFGFAGSGRPIRTLKVRARGFGGSNGIFQFGLKGGAAQSELSKFG